jgi:class 3 adenylate cyclase
MESKKETSYTYKVEDSAKRMDDILDTDDNDYKDKENSIPKRSDLTFKDGFYVNVTAVFIDIVDSSKLTDGHKRPTLAKMYRAFLSECVAIMNSWDMCKEININGDCVWGVFETPKKSDIDNVISVAAQLSSMVNILEAKYPVITGFLSQSVGIMQK